MISVPAWRRHPRGQSGRKAKAALRGALDSHCELVQRAGSSDTRIHQHAPRGAVSRMLSS
jgi:hypothetical protein